MSNLGGAVFSVMQSLWKMSEKEEKRQSCRRCRYFKGDYKECERGHIPARDFEKCKENR